MENELVQLEKLYGKGAARVRIPLTKDDQIGEYVILADYKPVDWRNSKGNMNQIMKQAEKYCTPRDIVEEQIQKRQTPGEDAIPNFGSSAL